MIHLPDSVVALAVKVGPYLKTVAGIVGAVIVTVACLSDGVVDDADTAVISAAWLTALGVNRIPNLPKG